MIDDIPKHQGADCDRDDEYRPKELFVLYGASGNEHANEVYQLRDALNFSSFGDFSPTAVTFVEHRYFNHRTHAYDQG